MPVRQSLHRKTVSLALPHAKSKPNLQSKPPSIYLKSKGYSKKKSTLQKKSSLPSNMYIYEPHSLNAQPILREAVKKHLNLKHVNHSYSRFLSQELVKAVKEDVQAIQYLNQKCSQIISLVREVMGFTLGDREVLVAEGKITKKMFIFFTASFYKPYSFCCQSVVYVCIYNPHQVMEILTHIRLPSEFMIDFVCSKCQKRILRMLRKTTKQRKLKKILTETDQNSMVRPEANPYLSSLFNESRQKISTTIMIASGRYKKIRINQSALERENCNGCQRSMNVSLRKKDKSLIFLSQHELKKMHRVKSQVLDELITKQTLK